MYGPDKLTTERKSFDRFLQAVAAQSVRLAPGTDAHNIWWHDGVTRRFGNNALSYALLRERGYRDEQLWHGPVS